MHLTKSIRSTSPGTPVLLVVTLMTLAAFEVEDLIRALQVQPFEGVTMFEACAVSLLLASLALLVWHGDLPARVAVGIFLFLVGVDGILVGMFRFVATRADSARIELDLISVMLAVVGITLAMGGARFERSAPIRRRLLPAPDDLHGTGDRMTRGRLDTVWHVVFVMALIVVVLFPLAACGETDGGKKPLNFGTVIDGQVYRGGQPTTSDIGRLRAMGVKTILKLNTRRADREAAATRKAGIRFIHIPFEPDEIGKSATCEDVARALEVMMDESNWPLYVHCARGRDRAGYMVGLYRLVVEDWSWSRIDAELTKYGHEEGERRSYPQIVRELKAEAPSCGPVIERAIRSVHTSASQRETN